MLLNDYTLVAKFHYLHHDEKGQRYANLSELGERLISAAIKANIRIKLIPISYQKGDFGLSAEVHLRRFLSKDVDDYFYYSKPLMNSSNL